jgi:hypothetical protein
MGGGVVVVVFLMCVMSALVEPAPLATLKTFFNATFVRALKGTLASVREH